MLKEKKDGILGRFLKKTNIYSRNKIYNNWIKHSKDGLKSKFNRADYCWMREELSRIQRDKEI